MRIDGTNAIPEISTAHQAFHFEGQSNISEN